MHMSLYCLSPKLASWHGQCPVGAACTGKPSSPCPKTHQSTNAVNPAPHLRTTPCQDGGKRGERAQAGQRCAAESTVLQAFLPIHCCAKHRPRKATSDVCNAKCICRRPSGSDTVVRHETNTLLPQCTPPTDMQLQVLLQCAASWQELRAQLHLLKSMLVSRQATADVFVAPSTCGKLPESVTPSAKQCTTVS
jgi:hypothetical protein